jgi:lipoprotein-anchoring transpeptidase ErfK/SrfK
MSRLNTALIWTTSGFMAFATGGISTIAASPPASNATSQYSATPNPPPTPASKQPQARAIESSSFADVQPPPAATAPASTAPQPVLIKIETLLDRAHFSPGVIDGKAGSNLNNAIATYAKAHNLPFNGSLTTQIFTALAAGDKQPVTQDYKITAEDEKGPFIGTLPADFAEQAKFKQLGYLRPTQELAEKFHMSEALLQALNPGADFGASGTSIVVVQPGTGDIADGIARMEVDKGDNQLRLLDNSGKIVAAYPATVGSTERPAPDGTWAVKFVTFHPDYTYDPKRLTFGKKSEGALVIAPGPNNPVGSTWIELTKPTYGIHGSPDPDLVGKTASHGCVRLTNWDASTVGHAVKKETPVVFVGETSKA